jgi:hypothetical protein
MVEFYVQDIAVEGHCALEIDRWDLEKVDRVGHGKAPCITASASLPYDSSGE